MKLLRVITFPFVPVYYLVTAIRNKLYDLGIKKSTSYKFPIICVGNLSVGGTGKTPMIEYLINLLKEDYRLATLSRGYKRATKGFRLANKNETASSLGDEPFQFYNKFGKDVLVAVDANRVNGIAKLTGLPRKPDIILLDDAYQHRKVKAGFNILLSTYNNLYTKDFVLPAGNLREPRSGANRADVIVVTKCPFNLNEVEKQAILKQIKPKAYQNVFFSTIKYAEEVQSANGKINIKDLQDFTLVTGIANPDPLVEFLKSKSLSFEHLSFKDHHDFGKKDIEILKKKKLIITTEKDFVRLKDYESLKLKLFYLPIEVSVDNSDKFDKLIEGFVNRY